MKMLAEVLRILQADELAPTSASIAIQAEKPRLSRHIDEIKNALADVLKIDVSAVGVSAGTNEGLGYVGEGKGITVNAYVLLK